MADGAIVIHRNKLARLAEDAEQSAKAVNLVYVTDEAAGISRKSKGKDFIYYLGKKKLNDKETLDRIKKLVLPPAWERVWICPLADGHLQATGYDARGRKQYKYHHLWTSIRSQTKFSHMYDFGMALPGIRKQIAAGLKLPGMPREKVLAAVVGVLQYTNVRIGNSSYEKEYGSYGLTTMQNKHVSTVKDGVQFSFKGKKGVYQQVTLDNKKLVRIVQQCKQIPGKELFQYYGDDGKRYPVDSGMVNEYIRQISGGNFTAKDFRTWFGSLKALQHLKEAGCCETDNERKTKIIEAIDAVARQLGNTRAVCRRYYIHPEILNYYNENKLNDFFSSPTPGSISEFGLSDDEQAMMKILELKPKIQVTEVKVA